MTPPSGPMEVHDCPAARVASALSKRAAIPTRRMLTRMPPCRARSLLSSRSAAKPAARPLRAWFIRSPARNASIIPARCSRALGAPPPRENPGACRTTAVPAGGQAVLAGVQWRALAPVRDGVDRDAGVVRERGAVLAALLG